MMRIIGTSLLLVGALLLPVSSVGAQDSPEGPNLMKIAEGTIGANSVRLRVRHDPTIYDSETWEVIAKTPGGDDARTVNCQWGPEGAPSDTAGIFDCDLFDLADGNYFFTIQVTNIGRTIPTPNTFLWHTVGPATGIVDPDLPGAYATVGSAGNWGTEEISSAQEGPQRIRTSWPAYDASDKEYPVAGYSVTVEGEASTLTFLANETSWLMLLTPEIFGDSTITVVPVTERGLINDALSTSTIIENRVLQYQSAINLEQLITAPDYDATSDPEVLRYYVAYFNRQPDLPGAKYWMGISRQGYDATEIAGFMAGSQEFANNYADTTDRVYLTRVYTNILGRDFDQAGFDYWLDTLQGTNLTGQNADRPAISRSEVVFWIGQGAEFQRTYPFR